MASPAHPQASSEDPKTESPKESKKFSSLLPNSGISSEFAAIPAQNFNYPSFSELLESVVKSANSGASSVLPVADQLLETVRFKGQFGMSHQEALASVTATATQMQFPAAFVNTPADTSLKVKTEVPIQPSSDIGQTKTPSSEMKDVAKTPNSDGYGWRKYGQKQVKSSESFRSYYRCTHVGCQAKKKVQYPDKSGCITGVDYKGHHNHDPPTKVKDKCHSTRTADGGSVVNTDNSKEEDSNKCQVDVDRNTEEQHDKKPDVVQSSVLMPPPEGPSGLSDTNEHTMTGVKKEIDSASGQKRRLKERARANSEHNQKSSKQAKVVVHASGDVDLPTDGYRWRKYGQKMVKGNPHPRSYYRCSSAGCPARKHVEKSTDNSTATLVTYEGEHDHDKPVPKKRHSPTSTTQCCADANGNLATEKAPEAKGTEKMIESARTLLSIGIELKSC